jgi:phage tail sheath protein FI
MNEGSTSQRWDFFLAHAGADTSIAIALYDALSPHARVFLDERTMLPGDPWTSVLPAVLQQSRIIVALVSLHTRTAWYQDSEIRIALDLLRDYPDRYRVIALLLDETAPIRRSDLPYGLEQTVPLSVAKCGGLQQVVQRLLETLRAHADRLDSEGADSVSSHQPVSLVDSTTAFVGQTERGPTSPILLTSWDDFARYFGRPLDCKSTYLPLAVRGFFENGGERAYVARVIASFATRAVVHITTDDPEQHLIFAARSVGAWGNRVLIRVQRGSRIGVRISIQLNSEMGAVFNADGQPSESSMTTEDFDNLSLASNGPNPILKVINSRSQLTSVEWTQEGRSDSMPNAGEWALTGGIDGPASVGDYIGTIDVAAQDRSGLASVALLDDVAIVCVPDATHPRFSSDDQQAFIEYIVTYCEQHKTFAILNTRSDQVKKGLLTAPADSSAAAIYFPWITVPGFEVGTSITIPPVGHIAGAYALHDQEHGVHVSPSGVELQGLLADSKSAGLDCTIDIKEGDDLVRRGVNFLCLEMRPPRRVTLRSAVTMSIDESWRRIGVRRFFNFVERSVKAGTAWVTKAPSNEATWSQVREEIEAFLTRLWRAGILSGSTQEEAFFVRCDRSTMTDDDIANGRVIWVMGVALVDQELKFPKISTATAPYKH